MKVTVVDSSCMLAIDMGGNSLMTHNTKAEGTDEPRKAIWTSYHKLDTVTYFFNKGAKTRGIKK